jgi:hypothetical protein
VQTLVQLLPPTEGGYQRTMIRQRLSQLLTVAAVKVAENKTPELIKAQLKVRRDALAHEVNDYRNALSNFIAPK